MLLHDKVYSQSAEGGGGAGGPEAALAEAQAKIAALEKSASETTAKVKEYEGYIMSPEFLSFLQQGGGGAGGKPETDEEKKKAVDDYETRLKGLSEADKVKYYLQEAYRQIAQPILQMLEDRESAASVAAASGEFKDFWDYKDEMVNLSKVHKTLNAFQLYALARVSSKPKVKLQPEGKVGAAGGAAPGGARGASRVSPSKSFDSAFEEAFKASGLEG